jgi:spore coat protein U-like protein
LAKVGLTLRACRIASQQIAFDMEISSMTRLHRMVSLPRSRPDGNRAPLDKETARMRRRKLALACGGLLGALALGLQAIPAIAATQTSTFAVTATVQATCLIAATALAFPVYTGVVETATSTITLTCTNTTSYNVGLSAGLGTGATVTARHMTGPAAAVLNYGLFSNATWTTNWGATIGTDTVTGIGNGAAQPITVYGQAAAGQYVAPGAYTDTITATITY